MKRELCWVSSHSDLDTVRPAQKPRNRWGGGGRGGAAGLSGSGAAQSQDGEEIALGGGGAEQVS